MRMQRTFVMDSWKKLTVIGAVNKVIGKQYLWLYPEDYPFVNKWILPSGLIK